MLRNKFSHANFRSIKIRIYLAVKRLPQINEKNEENSTKRSSTKQEFEKTNVEVNEIQHRILLELSSLFCYLLESFLNS